MSHNRKYDRKSLKRNLVKSKNITGIFKKMAKHNKDETENAISDRELNVNCSKIDVCLMLFYLSINESEKILVDDNKNTPVISEDCISNQSVSLLSLYTLKTLKISELNQCLDMRHYFLIFYFSSTKDSWLCKICTSFSQGHSGSTAFIDKPGKLGDHPTEDLLITLNP